MNTYLAKLIQMITNKPSDTAEDVMAGRSSMNGSNNTTSKQPWYSKKNLGIIMLVGLLLLVISMPTGDKSTTGNKAIDDITPVSNQGGVTDEDYKSRMEGELSQLLSFVEGVGEVQVMITLSASGKKVVEKDKATRDLDMEEETIYTDDGSSQNPYVNQEIYPEISGVIVAASGGSNPVVVKNITEAIQALFHIDTHKIKVMKMK